MKINMDQILKFTKWEYERWIINKSYWKGFLSGVAILSVLLSSTIVYAAGGTKIEVFFNNIKIMVDGVEKQPAKGKPFIYEGSTYIPLRFVSDALGKEIGWNDKTQTIWIGKQEEKLLTEVNEAKSWLDKGIAQASKLQSLSLEMKTNTLGGNDSFQIGMVSTVKADVIRQPSLILAGVNEQNAFGVPFTEQFYYAKGSFYTKMKTWETDSKPVTDVITEEVYDPAKLLQVMLAASADARINTSNDGVELQFGGSGEEWAKLARRFASEKDWGTGKVVLHEFKLSFMLDKETSLPKTLNVVSKYTSTDEDGESMDMNVSVSVKYDRYNEHKELAAPVDLKLQTVIK
jgi:hypothetical protein